MIGTKLFSTHGLRELTIFHLKKIKSHDKLQKQARKTQKRRKQVFHFARSSLFPGSAAELAIPTLLGTPSPPLPQVPKWNSNSSHVTVKTGYWYDGRRHPGLLEKKTKHCAGRAGRPSKRTTSPLSLLVTSIAPLPSPAAAYQPTMSPLGYCCPPVEFRLRSSCCS